MYFVLHLKCCFSLVYYSHTKLSLLKFKDGSPDRLRVYLPNKNTIPCECVIVFVCFHREKTRTLKSLTIIVSIYKKKYDLVKIEKNVISCLCPNHQELF